MLSEHRLAVPKSSPLHVASTQRAQWNAKDLVVSFCLFAIPLFIVHAPLLNLPFYWDELGQFVPTALDLLRTGSWVAHSTVPNVHPPGVEAYLVCWYKLFGFSIPITRIAMLLVASAGLLFTFLLAIELSGRRAAAVLASLFLFLSPLFYTQSMMAQLDMPAMAFTLLALLLFLKKSYASAATATTALVLVKETGIVVPFVLFAFLLWRKEWKRAAYFIAAAVVVAAWLVVLHQATGYWLGNPGFAHYNVTYALNPVRLALSFARRIYYLFFAEFRWIGTLAILFTLRKHRFLVSEGWRVTIAVAAANVALVSVFGGAELERYLLPVLAIFYITVAVALTYVTNLGRIISATGLAIGLVANLFWNPPYPFPFENNLAMVDFVRLQQAAAEFAERNLHDSRIATAWPYTAALRDPDYGFVRQKLNVIETNDFHASSIRALSPANFDVLITYTRTWAPQNGVISIPFVRKFLNRFYEWEPRITSEQCARLGLQELASWARRGQTIALYIRRNREK